MTETLEQIIEKTKLEHEGQHKIAFIGKVESGKTVMTALLKYALTSKWIPDSNEKWHAITSSGHDEINEILRNMKRGMYTSPTPEVNYPKLIIDVHDMRGQPTKINLILHDMSGENYIKFLTDPKYASIDERLLSILNGGGSYLAYANKYVIMVDCSKKEFWDIDDAKVAPMIGTLKKIKERIGDQLPNEKFHTPLAIVFTKTDTLPEDDQNKSAKELAEEYHELIDSLKYHCDMNVVEFFKMHVSSRKEYTDERLLRKQKNDEEYKKAYELWNNQIKTTIDQKVSKAETQAQQAGKTPEQIKKSTDSIRSKIKAEYDEQFKEKYLQKQSNTIGKWRVNTPLVYSESEYLKLISWLLDVKDDG